MFGVIAASIENSRFIPSPETAKRQMRDPTILKKVLGLLLFLQTYLPRGIIILAPTRLCNDYP